MIDEQIYEMWLKQLAQHQTKARELTQAFSPILSDLWNDPEIGDLWPTALSPNSSR